MPRIQHRNVKPANVKDGKPAVYILHFDRPYWTNCQHYVGSTAHLNKRMAAHLRCRGSLLVAYAIRKGCTPVVAKVEVFPTYIDARRRERQIKRKVAKNCCPICARER